MRFTIGQQVYNAKRPDWSNGEIIDVTDIAATVIFPSVGEKTIALAYLVPAESATPESQTSSPGTIVPGTPRFHAELKRRMRLFLAVADRPQIDKIEDKINRAFVQGEGGALPREIERQLRRWVETAPNGRYAQAIPAARALYALLFDSAQVSETELLAPAERPAAVLACTDSLKFVSECADLAQLGIEPAERPRYRVIGRTVKLQPGVEVVQPGKVPVFKAWRDRLILLAGDEQHADLRGKLRRDKFDHRYGNAPRIGSVNSEDAVTWSLLRTMEQRAPDTWLEAAMEKGLRRALNDQAVAGFPKGRPRLAFWRRLSPPPSLPAPEGDTEFDALGFVGDRTLVSIEAKVGAGLSPGTMHDPERNQFIRTLDVGSHYAEQQGKIDYWPVILLPAGNVQDAALVRGYAVDPTALAAALPHRSAAAIERLAKKIAIITWEDIIEVAASRAPA
jgi:hypothetical protein